MLQKELEEKIEGRKAEKEKNTDMRTEMNKLREENANMTAKLKEQKDEMKAMAEIINEQEAPGLHKPQSTTLKGLFIADSNGRNIKLPTNHQWNRPENIYTINHLNEYINQKTFRQEISTYDTTIIMLGTNHTRNGERATDVMDKIKNIADKLEKMEHNKIYFVQTPPLAQPINIK